MTILSLPVTSGLMVDLDDLFFSVIVLPVTQTHYNRHISNQFLAPRSPKQEPVCHLEILSKMAPNHILQALMFNFRIIIKKQVAHLVGQCGQDSASKWNVSDNNPDPSGTVGILYIPTLLDFRHVPKETDSSNRRGGHRDCELFYLHTNGESGVTGISQNKLKWRRDAGQQYSPQG